MPNDGKDVQDGLQRAGNADEAVAAAPAANTEHLARQPAYLALLRRRVDEACRDLEYASTNAVADFEYSWRAIMADPTLKDADLGDVAALYLSLFDKIAALQTKVVHARRTGHSVIDALENRLSETDARDS